MNTPTAASSPAAATASSAALRWLSLTVFTIFPPFRTGVAEFYCPPRIYSCRHYSECGGLPPPSNEWISFCYVVVASTPGPERSHLAPALSDSTPRQNTCSTARLRRPRPPRLLHRRDGR